MFMESSIALNARISQGQDCVLRLPGFPGLADAVQMTYDEKIGRVLKELIKRSGMTQAEVADLSGTDPTNLSRITNGSQSAPLSRLQSLARVLNVEPWQILRMADQGVTEQPTPDPRKAALQALIDALDPAQLDDAFRRWPVIAEERNQQYANLPEETPETKKKAG